MTIAVDVAVIIAALVVGLAMLGSVTRYDTRPHGHLAPRCTRDDIPKPPAGPGPGQPLQ